VLAGILSGQAREVAGAYRPWLEIEVVCEADGWACLAGARTR
jgi:ribosomal protein L11 methyltransferase